LGIAQTQIPVTLSFSVSPITPVYQQDAAFTVIASSTQGTPTGTAFLSDAYDGQLTTPMTLSNGSAVIHISTLAQGVHWLQVTFDGTGGYDVGYSAWQEVLVSGGPTEVNVTTSSAAITAGNQVTLNADVSGQGGSGMGGAVTFYDGANALASVALASVAISDVAATNQFANSDYWIDDAGDFGQTLGNVSPPQFTAGAAQAPDLTMRAAKLVFAAVSAGNISDWGQDTGQFDPVGGQTVTFSAWLSSDSTATVSLYLGTQAGALATQSCAVTTAWQRCSVTLTDAASDTSSNYMTSVASVGPQPAQTVYVWGGQLELGSSASPYVSTGSWGWAAGYGGTASFTTSTLPLGSNSITAVYSGDGSFAASGTSSAVAVAVNPVTIAISPATLPNGFIHVAYSTTLWASGGIAPYASWSFAGTAPSWLTLTTQSGGTGLLSGMPPAAGAYNFNVQMKDATGQAGSLPVTLLVSAVGSGTSSITFGSFGNGSPASFEVNVTPVPSGTATGTVTLLDGTTPLQTVAVGSTERNCAEFSVQLAPGSHTITAVYSGDSNYAGNSATTTVVITIPIPVALSLTVSPLSPVFQQAAAFMITATSLQGTPTGTVYLQDFGDGQLNTPVALSNGSAVVQLSTLEQGPHWLEVLYSGTGNYVNPWTTWQEVLVTGGPTETNVTASSLTIASDNNGVTLNAVVSGQGGPGMGGIVTFYDSTTAGTTALGSADVSGAMTTNQFNESDEWTDDAGNFSNWWNIASDPPPVTGDAATAPDGTMRAAQLNFPAVASGAISDWGQETGNFSPIGGQTVTFSTWLRSDSPATVSLYLGSYWIWSEEMVGTPAVQLCALTNVWQRCSVTFTEAVADNSSGFIPSIAVVGPAPAQTVYAWGGQLELGSSAGPYVPFDSAWPTMGYGGTATILSPALAVGSHNITAAYSGDGNFSIGIPSAPVVVTVGQPVTAVITAAGKAYDGTVAEPLANVSCTLTPIVNNLTCAVTAASFASPNAGTGITVTATGITLGGSAASDSFLLSTTATTTGSITPATPTLSLSCPGVPYNSGDLVTCIAALPSNATGSISFLDGGSPIGNGPIESNGVASFSISTLAVGSHTITASYSGDGNYGGATSNSITQVVNSVPVSSQGYSRYRPITINHSQVPADLSNFPLLISGNYPFLANAASGGYVQNPNGYDIIFTADPAGQTKLNHEIESYDPATGDVEFWVQTPLSAESDTVIYVWFDNPKITTSQENKTAVWTNYSSVWHVGDSTAVLADSTGKGNVGIVSGAVVADGEIGTALTLDGVSQHISAPTGLLNGQSTFTISFLIKSNDLGSSSTYWQNPTMVGVETGGGASQDFGVVTNGGAVGVWSGLGAPSDSSNPTIWNISTGNWYQIVLGSDGTKLSLYADGNIVSSSTYTSSNTAVLTYNGIFFGCSDSQSENGTAFCHEGAYDEMRTSTQPPSAAQVKAEYNNQFSPETFYTVGPGEVAGATPPPPSQPTIWNYAYESPITIQGASGGSALSNFPVLVAGTYPFLANTAYGGMVESEQGYDVIFTFDPAGTIPLPYEIDSYDPTTGKVAFWVGLPSLPPTQSKIYMWYGNSRIDASQENKPGVWSGYAGVWHLGNGATLSAVDSSGNGNNGTVSQASASTGQIGGGVSFTGANTSFLDLGHNASLNATTGVMISAWVQPNSPGVYGGIFTKGTSPANGNFIMRNASGQWLGAISNNDGWPGVDSTHTLSVGTWNKLDMCWDGNQITLYTNGAADGQAFASGPLTPNSEDAYIGYNVINSSGWQGSIDEVRLMTNGGCHSPGWVQTEYLNQSAPASFTAIGPPQNTWAAVLPYSGAYGYAYMLPIKIDHTQVVSDVPNTPLANFPVLVALTGIPAGSGLVTNENGYDIIFTSDAAGLSKVDHEIDSYDPVAGNGKFWVRIPSLSSTADTTIYAWYGNPDVSSSQENKAGVWPGYAGVWHFGNGTTLSAADSSGNGNSGTVSQASASAGQIGGGVSFTGANTSFLDVGHSALLSAGNGLMISAWVKPSSPGVYGGIFTKGTNHGTNGNYVMRNSGGNWLGAINDGNWPGVQSNTPLSAGSWYKLDMCWDGSQVSLYTNGKHDGQYSAPPPLNPDSEDAYIGYNFIDGSGWQGSIDEVRLMTNGCHLQGWVATEYNNQIAPASFAVPQTSQPNSSGRQLPSNGGYMYRRAITIDHNQVQGALTNFPVLISGTYSYLAYLSNGGKVQNPSGFDIVFTSDATGTVMLDHEIDNYDPSTGKAAFWVRMPQLASTGTDPVIYLWYGNSGISISQENRAGVWGNYLSVYHLNDPSGTVPAMDSAGSGYDLQVAGTPAPNGFGPTLGEVGGGWNFDGNASNYLYHENVSRYPSGTSPLTVQAWVKIPQPNPKGTTAVSYGANSYPGSRVALDWDGNNATMEFECFGVVGASPYSFTPGWHQLVGTYAGGAVTLNTAQVYVDGQPVASVATSSNWCSGYPPPYTNVPSITTTELKIGGLPTVICCETTEAVDEVRISAGIRSAGWIATEYANQSSPITFYTIDAEESGSVGSNLPPVAGLAPRITTVQPDSGYPGFSVTISGGPFGNSPSALAVTFNGTAGQIVTSSDNQLLVAVPKGATSGPLQVTVNGQASNSVAFTVMSASGAAASAVEISAVQTTGLLGQTINLSTMVTGGSVVPTGEVAFYDGVTPLGTVRIPADPAVSNLLRYSEAMDNPVWSGYVRPNSPVALPTIVANAGTAPDNSNHATKILFPVVPISALSGWAQLVPVGPLTGGRAFTYSVWLRADVPTSGYIVVEGQNYSQGAWAPINLTPNWTRYSVSYVFTGSTSTDPTADTLIRAQVVSSNSAAAVVYAWGSQLEESSTMGSYVSTAASAASGPGQSTATNLAQYSESIDNSAAWAPYVRGGTNPTVGANATTAPDGSRHATQINIPATAALTMSAWSQVVSTGNVTNNTYTFSVWLRADQPSNTYLELENVDTSDEAWSLISVGTQWQRYSVTGAVSTAGSSMRISVTGGGNTPAVTIYAWGAQLQQSEVAGPYVTTTYAPAGGTGGMAVLATSALTMGLRSITASYSGDSIYEANSSSSTTVDVLAPSATSLTCLPASFVYGSPVTCTASATGAGVFPSGTVTFMDSSKAVGTASLSGGQATFTTTLLGAGSHSITAVYAGDTNYVASTSTATALTITPEPLTITANNAAMTYGATLPVFGETYSGFVNGESPSALGGVPSFTTQATSQSPVGTYDIVIAQGTITDQNYSYTLVNGILTITPAPVTVTAANVSMTYGTPAPALTPQYTGLMSWDSAATAFSGAPQLTTTAGPASPVGSYTISVAAGTLWSWNYAFTFTNANLTVVPAALSVSAKDVNIVHGAAIPAFTPTYTGFVNNDGPLSGIPNMTTTATSTSGTGTYTISVTQGNLVVSSNYTVSCSNASLTITGTSVSTTTLTSSPASPTYGQSVMFAASVTTGATGTMTFYVDGGKPAVVSLSGSAASYSTAALMAGSHTITAIYSGDGTYAGGGSGVSIPLSVAAAPLTVTATNVTIVQGSNIPTPTATYSGFVLQDNVSVLAGSPAIVNTANVNLVGTYDINISAGTLAAPNYQLALNKGKAQVVGAPTITSITPSQGPPDVGFTITGQNFGNAQNNSVVILYQASTNQIIQLQNVLSWGAPDPNNNNNQAISVWARVKIAPPDPKHLDRSLWMPYIWVGGFKQQAPPDTKKYFQFVPPFGCAP
jgi:hypothetical protein